MSPVNCQMRRATVDDLAKLRMLWKQAELPVAALERCLTEFQVAEGVDGTLLACLGLRLEAQHGKIHSAAYRSLETRLELEQRLWERMRSVARNHGLWKLWTQDGSPFWRAQGFQEADENVLKKLPPRFGEPAGAWLFLPLRDEIAPAISVEQEFELFKQAQRDGSDRAFRQARVLRFFAIVIGTMVLLCALGMAWYFLRHLPKLTQP